MHITAKILLAFSLASITSLSYASDEFEGGMSLLAGKSEQTYTHDDWAFRAKLIAYENYLMKFEHEVSEESEGGYDNNAVVRTSNVYQIGYIDSLSDSVNVYGTLGYVGVESANKEKGGSRLAGNYSTYNFHGNMITLGLIAEPFDNTELEAEYFRIDYNEGPSSDVIQLTGTYYFTDHIGFSGTYYNNDFDSGSLDAWKLGVTAKF